MVQNEELLKELYFTKDYNCAESSLRYFNVTLGLHIQDEDLKLLGGFGGGMGCGRTCGALAGAIAVISRVRIQERAHENPAFKALCGEFVQRFEEKMSTIECAGIKERVFVPEERCWKTVIGTAELLEGFLL